MWIGQIWICYRFPFYAYFMVQSQKNCNYLVPPFGKIAFAFCHLLPLRWSIEIQFGGADAIFHVKQKLRGRQRIMKSELPNKKNGGLCRTPEQWVHIANDVYEAVFELHSDHFRNRSSIFISWIAIFVAGTALEPRSADFVADAAKVMHFATQSQRCVRSVDYCAVPLG